MEPNWKPLVDNRDEERCVGFMFMGRMNGINLHKHGVAGRYLHLGDRGQCYVIEQKRRALQKAGISHERIEIQPEDLSLN